MLPDLPGGEMHKSASFVSGRTNPNSDENQPLMQSSVSLIGPDGQPIDTEEGKATCLASDEMQIESFEILDSQITIFYCLAFLQFCTIKYFLFALR